MSSGCKVVKSYCRRAQSGRGRKRQNRSPCDLGGGKEGVRVKSYVIPKEECTRRIRTLQKSARRRRERTTPKQYKKKKKASFSQEAVSLKQDRAGCIRIPASMMKNEAIPLFMYLDNVDWNCIQGKKDPFMRTKKLHDYARSKAPEVGMPAVDEYVIEPSTNLDLSSTSNHLCLVPKETFTCKQRVQLALSYMEKHVPVEIVEDIDDQEEADSIEEMREAFIEYLKEE